MNKKRQNNLMKITALLIMQIFIFASVGFCLSPEILFDSKLVQIAFEQSNIEDKVLSIELPEWSEYTVEVIDEHPELKNQLASKLLEYQARLLKRKQDGALFFLKTRHQPRELNQLDYIWPTKNEASRENAAFALGRFMDANVCDIILPEKEQAKALAAYIGALPEDIYLVRVANDYKLSDEQVRQKTFKEAFTRNLVLAFLIRKYDFDAASAANNSSISDSRVLMMFDNEQSFHKGLINIKQFSEAFMGNYSLILESISVNELAETVNFLENEFDIDKVLDIMSDHDNYRMVQSFLNLEYAEDRAKTIRKDMLEFFNYIFTFNLEFARNTPEYEQLSKEIAQIKQALSLDSGKIKTVNNQLDTAQYLLLESI